MAMRICALCVLLVSYWASASVFVLAEAPVFEAHPERRMFGGPGIAESDQASVCVKPDGESGYRMLGSLQDESGRWALVLHRSGQLMRVTAGDALDPKRRVIEVTPKQTVVEWQEPAGCATQHRETLLLQDTLSVSRVFTQPPL
ncbi:hypothetical protein [Photobacterium sp. 1_MG-2023]|uniref:hypothetical protein n=1 Tax=Photobacterium sp. 1_MG-2023 TaxID=3062646 RepID=UPI0026E13857|nr:hypothetical protein [Photobacterium sp. 1_MG-2023]MDO6706228.1 hypothetical protein [Photobacterium sp. 1_MG-2023]